ncbi:hypothetical protein VA603_00490 [Stenotrophomonas sp. MH1]|uniref:TonB C-terminal domain-containing protein n=1 Tax=Stenotrophomonas capsici TaxID=3110230 RepID=A0ABU5UZQ9_9GAMM|nr:hypothetical protein [Stenotrophomonas sp. MH1]MEA5666014.1 hypothetical protein [Stenotrophomonas sp. MH1]
MRMHHLAVPVLLWLCGPAAAQDSPIYIEFLWSRTPADAIARQQTRQFVMTGDHEHQICVAANATTDDVGGLQLELRDADGKRVSLHRYDDYRGAKRCYRADLGIGGRPGDWTAHVLLGDGGTNTATIRVDPSLEDSPLFQERGIPYVAGRPNYDASIPPEQWSGRLVWAMDVDPQGKVTHVEVEVAEGVGERLRDRAIAAGYLNLFPPDPGRAGTPLRWRRTLDFAPQ